MKFRHTVYPSPLVCTSAGDVKFEDHTYETDDKKLQAALKKTRDVEVVPAKPSSSED